MERISAFEAKTHFARLLRRVAQGEQLVITRHGVPVARLVPFAGADRETTRQAVSRLKSLRKGHSLAGLAWKELRDEGRK